MYEKIGIQELDEIVEPKGHSLKYWLPTLLLSYSPSIQLWNEITNSLAKNLCNSKSSPIWNFLRFERICA